MIIFRFNFSVLLLSLANYECYGWSYSFTSIGRQLPVEFENYLSDDSNLILKINCDNGSENLEVTWKLMESKCFRSDVTLSALQEDSLSATNCSEVIGRGEKIILHASVSRLRLRCPGNDSVAYSEVKGAEIELKNNGSCEKRPISPLLPGWSREFKTLTISPLRAGLYRCFLDVRPTSSVANHSTISGVLMKLGKHGHLSRFLNWKHVICSSMCVVYLLLSSVWLAVWTYSRKYTSRIHVALGLVSVIGSLGNIFSAVELSVFNSGGQQYFFLLMVGGSLLIIYHSLVKIIFLAAGTGVHIIRVDLNKHKWVAIILLTVIGMCVEIIQLFIPRGRADEPTEGLSLASRFQTSATQNYISLLECVIQLASASLGLSFCIMSLYYLYLRRHSSHGKFIAFSIFTSVAVVIFVAYLVSAVWMATEKFSCINSELTQMDWFTSDLLPQFKSFAMLVAVMLLWRPVDEFRSYGFQALKSQEDDMYVHYTKAGWSGSADGTCDIVTNVELKLTDY